MAEVKERKMKELVNGRSKVLDCNYEVLKNIIISRGFTPRELAKAIGYDRSYFSKVAHANKIGITCVRLLKTQYNILPQQYEVVGYEDTEVPVKPTYTKQKVLAKLNKPEPKTESIVLKITVDADQLKQLVKQAVLEAFNSL